MDRFRKINPNGLYHVFNRGNNQENIFIDEIDKSVFLRIISKHIKRYSLVIYAYCIMDNHFHLYFDDLYENLSDFMRDVQARYAEYFNNRYNHCGHVFQGRFGSCIVNGYSYIIKLIRYILRNPVKAGIVCDAKRYEWSSLGRSNSTHHIVDPVYVELLFENANRDFETYINNNEDDELIAAIEKQTYKYNEALIKYKEILRDKFNIAPEKFSEQDTDLKLRIIMWCRYLGISSRQLKDIANVTISFVRRATPKDIEYL